jgi:hypothetical protein
MRSFLNYFFYHQFFISICAVAMSYQTVLILHLPLTEFSFYSFVFFATMLSYTAHFWLASKKSNGSMQLQWYCQHQSFTITLLLISFIGLIISFFYIRYIWPFILAATLLNLFYTGPLLFKKPLQLPKLFTYVKSYVIGFVWAYVSVILPIALVGETFTISILVLFFNRFLLVSLLVLIFDYRDKLPDYEFGIHTPANAMNEKEFGGFFLVNAIVYSISVVLLALFVKEPVLFLQFLLAPLMILLQQQSKKQPSDFFYLFRVDGVMILSLLLSLFLLI